VKPNRNGPPTLSREFNGNPTVGIVLDPRCVSGLDLAGFAAPPAEEAEMLVRRYEMPWRRAYEVYAGIAWWLALLYFVGSASPARCPGNWPCRWRSSASQWACCG
jgi:hypothetical protein